MFVHRFFWPDTPACATILGMIAQDWVKKGHDVSVFTAFPAYFEKVSTVLANETARGVNIFRCRLPFNRSRKTAAKALSGALFLMRLFFFVLSRRKYDVIISSTMPPVLNGLVSLSAARLSGARFIYQCMDIHPEVAITNGMVSEGVLTGFLKKLDQLTCRFADCVHVLSDDMRNALVEGRTGGKGMKVAVISNPALEELEVSESTAAAEISLDERKFNLLFAGNLGRFQALPELVLAMEELVDEPEILLTLMGHGVLENSLKSMVHEKGLRNVRFVDFQPLSIARQMIKEADVCVVSLTKNVYKYAFPSKVSTILDQGTPLFGVVEAESCLARLIGSRGIGWSCGHDSKSIAWEIRSAYASRGELPLIRENVTKAYDEEFRPSVILDRWQDLLNQVAHEES